MARRDVRLGQLLRVHIDGVPLDLASRAAARAHAPPLRSADSHPPARRAARRATPTRPARRDRAPRRASAARALRGLIDSLRVDRAPAALAARRHRVGRLLRGRRTTADAAIAHKDELVARFLDRRAPATSSGTWARTPGASAASPADRGHPTRRLGRRPGGGRERTTASRASEGRGRCCRSLLDLTNPSPAHRLGARGAACRCSSAARPTSCWRSRSSTTSRSRTTCRCRASPTSSPRWAHARRSSSCPRSDSQVQRLLATREDIFADYTQDGFEAAFAQPLRDDRGPSDPRERPHALSLAPEASRDRGEAPAAQGGESGRLGRICSRGRSCCSRR